MATEERIKELEKKVEKLSYIHAISDKFGTYQSLCKDAEILMFFLANKEQKRRYCELIDNFTGKGWGRSTVETHLHKLTERRILERTSLPGEYQITYDMSRDLDMLVHYLIGDSLYRLAKKSWKNNDYIY